MATNWSEIKSGLMHLACNRGSWYSNSYPYNCLYIHDDGSVSCDCIGLIKNMVNTPNQAYNTTPGSMGNPGSPLPDLDEWGLINLCPDQSRDFSNLQEGEILMTVFDGCGEEYGHGGWFVGEFIDPTYGSVQNTIECTSAYEYNGIFSTYTDAHGYHWTSKGGRYIGQWDMHGHLSGYVNYDGGEPEPTPPQPTPTPTPEVNEPTYLTYDDVDKCWLPMIKGSVDYAGVYGHDVSGIAIQGLKYQVHCWAGDGSESYEFADWLEPVSGFDINDFENGWAGNYHPIDALAIYGEGYSYKVHLRGGDWLEVVSSDNGNISDSENGYAGIIGKPIDAVMIWKR